MSGDGSSFLCRRAERILLAVGIACLAWYAAVSVQTVIYQREERTALERIRARPVDPGHVFLETNPGDLIGLLEVPRLNLSAVVVEGDDEGALVMAIGHLPDTPLPWQRGNSALAAHRDTFFRPLKDIRVGDRLRIITTVNGELEYQVRETLIVGPDDVWVLAPTEQANLTLVTCYPFSYIGHAPERFVVHAEQVGRSRREF